MSISSPYQRYAQNRNLWRKTTSVLRRQRPQLVELIDGQTGEFYTIDITKMTRERSPYERRKGMQSYFMPDLPNGEYEEGLIQFTADVSQSFSFEQSFSEIPFIVFSVESPSNVNVFGLEVTEDGGVVGLSETFTGHVRYRAIYAPLYPVFVSSSYSQSFIATAGAFVTDDSSFESGDMATVQFFPVSDIRSSPIYIGSEPDYEPYDTNVAVTHTFGEGSMIGSTGSIEIGISAPMSNNNEVQYIAVLGRMPSGPPS